MFVKYWNNSSKGAAVYRHAHASMHACKDNVKTEYSPQTQFELGVGVGSHALISNSGCGFHSPTIGTTDDRSISLKLGSVPFIACKKTKNKNITFMAI